MVSISPKEARIAKSGHASTSGSKQLKTALQCAKPRASRKSISASIRNMPMIRRRVSWQRPHVRVVVCLERRLVHSRNPNERRIEQAKSIEHLHLLGKYKSCYSQAKTTGLSFRRLPHHLIFASAAAAVYRLLRGMIDTVRPRTPTTSHLTIGQSCADYLTTSIAPSPTGDVTKMTYPNILSQYLDKCSAQCFVDMGAVTR